MTSTKFAARVGVSVRTLLRWHNEGVLVPAVVLPGGERRYSEEQAQELEGARQPCRKPSVRQIEQMRAARAAVGK